MVRTDGPDGALHDYPIAYTFGVYPLQQYLIAFPGGRLQALGSAWDSRPKDQGGQRWFHLYPGQQLKTGDPLHWTGRDQTWNYQCADCHSTDLKKNFDLATNTYTTSWTDLDVACEACHGPGSRHVAWAKAHAAGGAYPPGTDTARMGLSNWLKPTDTGRWEMNPETGTARRPLPNPPPLAREG
jgi:Cytochrome c554 and c-prime